MLRCLLRFMSIQIQNAINDGRTINARIKIISSTCGSRITTGDPSITLILILSNGHLIRPIPGRATLRLIMLMGRIPMILRIACAIARNVNVFTRGRKTNVALIRILTRPPSTYMRKTVSITLKIMTAPFMLCKTNEIYLLNVIVRHFRILTMTQFITREPNSSNKMITITYGRTTRTLRRERLPI